MTKIRPITIATRVLVKKTGIIVPTPSATKITPISRLLPTMHSPTSPNQP